MKNLFTLFILSILVTSCAHKGSHDSNTSVHKKLQGMWYLGSIIGKEDKTGKTQDMMFGYGRLCDLNKHPEFKNTIQKKPIMFISSGSTGKIMSISSTMIEKGKGSCTPIESFRYKFKDKKMLVSFPKGAIKYIDKMEKLPNGVIKDADIGYAYFMEYQLLTDNKVVMSTNTLIPGATITYTLNR